MESTWNPLWGRLIVEECRRNGVTVFCVSPGSRSTPLTISLARNSGVTAQVFIDERAAAYFALGYARATGKPAALVCTSGTAVANYLPAVIEASVEHLPLLIFSADRPPELKDSGANQTIDQSKLFGGYVRWFHDPGCPGPDAQPEALLSAVDQAIHRTCHPLPGPVHLNFPFREPFHSAPEDQRRHAEAIPERWEQHPRPWIKMGSARLVPHEADLDSLVADVPKKGVLSLGRMPEAAQPAVKRLAEALGWPVFADVTSGLRLGSGVPHRITHYDQLLLDGLPSRTWQPEVVWHLGFPPTSKRWLTRWEHHPSPRMVWVADHSERLDSSFQFSERLTGDLECFTEGLLKRLPVRPEASLWLQQWQEADRTVANQLTLHLNRVAEAPDELQLAHALTEEVPPEHALFVGNSLPVRMIDFYGSGEGHSVPIGLNRGASGIDGVVASALGFARGLQRPTTLWLGDLSALHDLNSLALCQEATHPLILIISNNHGGGIFSFLPIAQQEDVFERFFGTPHAWSFEKAAELFGLEYQAPASLADWRQAYRQLIRSGRSGILEVVTSRQGNVQAQQQWQQVLRASFPVSS